MRVLLTGSGGRIGRAIALELTSNRSLNIELTTLDRDPQAQPTWLGDVADAKLLQRAMAGIHTVIHTAALHAPHVSIHAELEFTRINVQGTKLLIEAAVEADVGRIIYTSTTALYGRANAGDGHTNAEDGRAAWLTEESRPQPITIYHRTKLAAEQLLAEAVKTHNLSVFVLRMSRCFPEPAPQMAAYRLHRGVDARDVAVAHACALARINRDAQFETYIISGATPFLPDDAPALYADAPAVLKLRAPELVAAFAQRGWPLPQSIDRVYDASRALRELNWQPRFGYPEVLRQADSLSSEVLPYKIL